VLGRWAIQASTMDDPERFVPAGPDDFVEQPLKSHLVRGGACRDRDAVFASSLETFPQCRTKAGPIGEDEPVRPRFDDIQWRCRLTWLALPPELVEPIAAGPGTSEFFDLRSLRAFDNQPVY